MWAWLLHYSCVSVSLWPLEGSLWTRKRGRSKPEPSLNELSLEAWITSHPEKWSPSVGYIHYVHWFPLVAFGEEWPIWCTCFGLLFHQSLPTTNIYPWWSWLDGFSITDMSPCTQLWPGGFLTAQAELGLTVSTKYSLSWIPRFGWSVPLGDIESSHSGAMLYLQFHLGLYLARNNALCYVLTSPLSWLLEAHHYLIFLLPNSFWKISNITKELTGSYKEHLIYLYSIILGSCGHGSGGRMTV
jgi:hypothetical protein